MPILTVVGPPGVGKSYICQTVKERLGEYAMVIKSPSLSNLAEKPPTMEEAYSWAFNVIHTIPDTDDKLYIFDSFPHPDFWVINHRNHWGTLQENMEVRLNLKRSAQLIVTPSSWKAWVKNSLAAKDIRLMYDDFMYRTKVPGRRVNMSEGALTKAIEELGIDSI